VVGAGETVGTSPEPEPESTELEDTEIDAPDELESAELEDAEFDPPPPAVVVGAGETVGTSPEELLDAEVCKIRLNIFLFLLLKANRLSLISDVLT